MASHAARSLPALRIEDPRHAQLLPADLGHCSLEAVEGDSYVGPCSAVTSRGENPDARGPWSTDPARPSTAPAGPRYEKLSK